MRGIAISRIPAEIFERSHSEAAQAYLNSKYSKYGFKREHPIVYNPEYIPESQKHTYNPDKYRWVENVSDGLRKVGNADDVIRLGHTGWFVDNFQDETVRGEVYQLPSRGVECQYVPAVNDPWNKDCACVDFSSITNDKEDCARWADSMAERWAESEREFQAKEQARIRLEEIEDEIKQLYADYRQTVKELREAKGAMQVPVVRRMIRKEWRELKADVHKLRAEARKIEREGIEY